MSKKILFAFLIGLLISSLSLYFTFQNIPADQLLSTLSQIHYHWILPSILLVVFAFIFRTLRWQILLQADTKVSFRQAYHPLQIGFMINCTIPARIGELARPFILSMQSKVTFPAALGSIVLERFLDLIFMITSFTLITSFVSIDPELNLKFGPYVLDKTNLISISKRMQFLLLLITVCILLLCFDRVRDIIKNMIQKIPVINTRLIRHFENFSSMLISVKKARILVPSILSTLAVWLLHALSYYILTCAFGGIHLTIIESFFYMIIICFFITLPSVPGYWGLWEAGGVFATLLLGYPEDIGAAFTLVNHAVQLFPVIILGLISLLFSGTKIKNLKNLEKMKK